MSETNATPAADLPVEAPRGATGNRKLLLALGGLAGVAVLGLAAFFLFFSGGSGGQDTVTVVAKGKPPASAPKAKPKSTTVPAVYHGNVGRDPFKPLANEATPPPPPPTQAPTPTPAPTLPAPTTATVSLTVNSTDITHTPHTAWITFSGVKQRVTVGSVLASTIKVTSITSSAVYLQLGDSAPVPVKVGATTSVVVVR